MEKIAYVFRAFEATDAIKDLAAAELMDLIEIFPDSAHFKWTFDFDKKHHEAFAELIASGYKGGPLVIREQHEDLYTAISHAARKLRQLYLNRREVRRAGRHEAAS